MRFAAGLLCGVLLSVGASALAGNTGQFYILQGQVRSIAQFLKHVHGEEFEQFKAAQSAQHNENRRARCQRAYDEWKQTKDPTTLRWWTKAKPDCLATIDVEL